MNLFDEFAVSLSNAFARNMQPDRGFEYGLKHKHYSVNNFGMQSTIHTKEYRVKCLTTNLQVVFEIHTERKTDFLGRQTEEIQQFEYANGETGIKFVYPNNMVKIIDYSNDLFYSNYSDCSVDKNEDLMYDYLTYVLTEFIMYEKINQKRHERYGK